MFSTILSCNKFIDFEETSLSIFYADSVYLGFEGDLWNPVTIDKNWDIYKPAHERMIRHLKFQDNQLQWNYVNAQELKISGNIYDYIIECFNNENEQLKSGDYYLELLSHGYAIKQKAKSKTAQILLRSLRVVNYRVCYEIYLNAPCEYLSEYIDFRNSEMEQDPYGGQSIQGLINHKFGFSTFYAYNGCSENDMFRCDINFMASAYCSDRRGGKYKMGSVIAAKLNSYHKHICAVTGNFTSQTPYNGNPLDLIKILKLK